MRDKLTDDVKVGLAISSLEAGRFSRNFATVNATGGEADSRQYDVRGIGL